MKAKNLTLIFILSGALLSLRAAHGAAFINGSFELPGGLPPNSYLHLSPGDTSLVGWSIGGSGGFVANNNGMSIPELDFNPVDGNYHLSFNGGDQAPGAFLSQSFDTIVGQQYDATFFVGRVGNGGGEVSLTVTALSTANDVLGSLQAFPPSHGYGTIQSLSFTATSATTTLRFTDTSLVTVSVDVMLDNVAVTPVLQSAGFINGSFELPGGLPPNGYFYILPSGSTFIDGWTVGGQGIDYFRNGIPGWGASDGIWWVDLVRGPGEGGTITQVATDLVPGTAYYLCFDLFQVEITANTTVSATFGTETRSFLNSYPSNWTPHQVKLIATSSTASVTFAAPAVGAADSGVFLDHVRILTNPLMQPTLSLTPVSAQNPVGTVHTLTARVITDIPTSGTPVPNTLVTFKVISGPNAGQNGTGTTDASGLATFSYTGSGGAGVDVIQASFVDDQQRIQVSNNVTKDWVNVCPTPADLLPYQATGYRYRVIGSGVPPPDGWEQSAYDDSAWSVGAAAFGTGLICPLDNTVQTAWPLNTDLLVRRVVFVPAGAVNLRVWIGIDNDILEVFFNGTSLGGNIVHENCAVLDDFSFAVPQALVQAGPNVVAYYLRDRGVVSFFDTRLSACVPLSSSCALICPQDITAPNDPGTCSAIVNFPPPTASGDCSGLTITCTPPSGSTFPVGPSVVTCTATDANGYMVANCSFLVVVTDTGTPVASYAVVKAPVLVANPPRIAGWFRLLATDNCDPDPLIYLKGSAGSFVAGPFHNGDQVEIAHARGLIPRQAPSTFGGNIATIQLDGDALLWAVDSSGNASTPIKCK